MEKMLQKLARQLDSLDEASLMTLWGKYATLTSHFEPTRQWEEACLIFSLIQAKHWKNQLFNYSWRQQRTVPDKDGQSPFETEIDIDFGLPQKEEPEKSESFKCHVLAFKPLKEPEPVKMEDKDG